ncbi:MAG: calcium/sodium antiporter [Myxococcota bacterium]|nr:calcium/sodium antiporter [Myxococcota bacterium]
MLFQLLLLLSGIAMLWLSSDVVVRAIGPIARRLRVKEIVVTILGVSALSSMPELSVSLLSALRGNADVSVGNVVGSNFVTLTFVTALCALISPLDIGHGIRDRESSWMILSTVIILLLAQDGELSRLDGAVLVLLYVPYLWSVIAESRKEKHDEHYDEKADGKIWVKVLMLVGGIVGIIIGAKLAVDGGSEFGRALGIPELALGAVLFAFGTSLPELAIAVAATLKKKTEVSLAEVYASNIFTALVVLGCCCLAAPLHIADQRLLTFDIPMLVAAGVMIQIFITTGMRFNRWEAAITMVLYGYFVYVHLVPGVKPWAF